MGNTDDQLSKLSAQEKRALLDKLLKERQRSQLQGADRFGFPPEYAALAALYENEDGDGIADLFFQSFEGTNGNLASIAGRSFSNFCRFFSFSCRFSEGFSIISGILLRFSW